MTPDLEEKLLDSLKEHEGYIYSIIRNKASGSPSDYDEIFQEVCTNVWKHRARFRFCDGEVKKSQFKKWVASFTHNQVVWYFSKKKRKEGRVDFNSEKFDVVSSQLGAEDPAFAEDIDKESISHLYHKYSSILTPQERNVFRLMWRGLKIDDIGRVVGVTHQRVSQIADEIKSKIKNRFKSSVDEVVDANTLKLPQHLNAVADFLNSAPRGNPNHIVHK